MLIDPAVGVLLLQQELLRLIGRWRPWGRVRGDSDMKPFDESPVWKLPPPGDLRSQLPARLCTVVESGKSAKNASSASSAERAMGLTRLKPVLGEKIEVLHCELECQRSPPQLTLLNSVVGQP